MTYRHQEPPQDPGYLSDFLSRELQRIEAHTRQWDLEENPRWEGLVVLAGSMRAGADGPDFGTLTGSLMADLFGPSAPETLHFTACLPRSYREQSAIRPYVRWASTATASGAVAFQLVYAWSSASASLAESTLSGSSDVSNGYAASLTPLGPINGTGKRAGSVLVGRITRLGGDVSDTYVHDVGVLAIEFRYEKDAHGSRRETVK